jgi:hypothetical protein
MKRLRRLISGRRNKGAKAEPAMAADDDEHDEPVYAQTRRTSMAPRSSSDSGTDVEYNPTAHNNNADDSDDGEGHYARADHVVPPRDAQHTPRDDVLLRNKGIVASATLSPAARRAALLRRRSCASEPGEGDGPELPPRRYSAVIKPDGSLTLLPPLPAPPGQSATAGGGPRSSLSAGVSAASPSPSLAHDAPDSPPLVMHSRLAQLRGFKPVGKEGERCDSGLASNASEDQGSICSLPRALADAVSSSGSREALAAEVRRHSIGSGQGSHRSLLNSKGQEPAALRGASGLPPQRDHHYESLEGADGSDSEDEEVQIYGQEIKLPQGNQGDKGKGPAPTTKQPAKGPVARDTARAQAYEAWDHCSRAEPGSKITERTEAFFAQRASGGSGHLRQLASAAALSGGTTPEDGDDDVDDRGMTRLVGRPEDDHL